MTTIHVVLVNAATNQVFGESELALEQLPETFELATTMHIGDVDWSVERAEPPTRTEFAASGQLRLVLRKVEHIDPKSILFSLPTIENTLPPGHEADSSNAHRMREDDWRQLELVAVALAPVVEAELAEIRSVYEDRVGPGFKRIHVRERIVSPLEDVQLGVDDLARALGNPPRRDLTVYQDPGGIVTGGFAFSMEEGVVYGREDAGHVLALGVDGELPAELAELADHHALLVVDWCRAAVRQPT